ncbi:MAG: SRPBCC family protein [Sumerlaeia bacterium]
MPNMQQSIVIDQPASVVARHYTDWEKYPEFMPAVEKCVPSADGRRVETHLKVAGMSFHWTSQIEATGDTSFAWKTVDGNVSHRGTTVIEPLSEERSRMTMTVEYDTPAGSLLSKFANWLNLADSGLKHSLENFKAYVENQPARV